MIGYDYEEMFVPHYTVGWLASLCASWWRAGCINKPNLKLLFYASDKNNGLFKIYIWAFS